MREGDLLLSNYGNGFQVAKLLRLKPIGGQWATAHVLLYHAFASRPSPADVARAPVLAWHAPLGRAEAERDCEVIGNWPVTPRELAGYREYLKHTDFRDYLNETGITFEQVIARAQSEYDLGNRLCDARQFEPAIVAFSRAIEHYPEFYEAHDNRALALMDLARYGEAAEGFEESLRIKPDNRMALFSRGECFLRLGKHERAAEIFRECLARWPNQPHHQRYLQEAQALASGKVAKTRPWWRLW